jgi:precorrin-6A/cobalt-precorrin-6A reductase
MPRATSPAGGRRVIALLGGTDEASRLAAELAVRPGLRIVTSWAGATVGAPAGAPAGATAGPTAGATVGARAVGGPVPDRVGGFGGPDGLAAWLLDVGAHALVDATHPFAATISASAHAAALATGIPLIHLRRPGWEPVPGDRWHRVDSPAAAADLAPTLGERIFLTTGRRGGAPFAADARAYYLLRCIRPPEAPLPARLEVIIGRGPFSVDGELELLRQHRIDVLVSKDSGGELTVAKLTAARRLGLDVVMIDRPPAPPGAVCAATVEEVLAWLDGIIPAAGLPAAGLSAAEPRSRPARPPHARESGR